MPNDDISIVDADTIRIGNERVRILNIDAPESWKSRCPAELAIALRAKDRLRELLAVGAVEIERSGSLDRYGRTLANITVNGSDVGNILISENLAVEWRPGKKAWAARARHWCPHFEQVD